MVTTAVRLEKSKKSACRDLVYTINGWIKSLNGSRLHKHSDPGNDGQGFHGHFGEDVFSYSLDYFNGDYQAVGSVQHLMDKGSPNNNFNTQFVGLFNGNIAAITTNILQPNGASNLQAQLFRYDALNRLKQSVTVDAKQKMLHNGPLSWNNSTTNTLSSTYSYDAAGNLSHLTRKNESNQTFDDFEYQYNTNTNQLNRIKENALSNNGVRTDDIDYQIVGNYNYDLNGRLISDVHDGVTLIKWSKSDKVLEVQKSNGTLTIKYNALDQKVSQSTARNDSIVTEYFVYDPSGNVLASYGDTIFTNGHHRFALHQLSIYGSSRIGLIEVDSLLWKDGSSNVVVSNKYNQKLGLKRYELSNHLGNVQTVVSDRKMIQGNGQNAYFVADVISVTDYYAFGMKITERTWQSDSYRFGFNGKDFFSDWNRSDYGFRIYDDRKCRFESIDPLHSSYPELTTYQFASNRPMDGIDLDGLEFTKPVVKDGVVSTTLVLYFYDNRTNKDKAEFDKYIKQTENDAKIAFNFTEGYTTLKTTVKSIILPNKPDESTKGWVISMDDYVYNSEQTKLVNGHTRTLGDMDNNLFQIANQVSGAKRRVDEKANTTIHELLHGLSLRHPWDPQQTIDDINDKKLHKKGGPQDEDVVKYNYLNSGGNPDKLAVPDGGSDRNRLTSGQKRVIIGTILNIK